MNKPLISIIIPAYNAARLIGETLASIPGSTTQSYEVIVIDDGSTDDTVAVVERLAPPNLTIVRQPNRGVSAARNNGLRAAKGEYILCLDSDDRLCPHAIDRLLARLQGNPHAILAYGNYVNIDGAGRVMGQRGWLNGVKQWLGHHPEGDCLRQMLQVNFIVNPGAALMRRSMMQGEEFDTRIAYGEDAEYWCRIALHGEFVHVKGAPVLEYRRHQSSVSSTTKDVTAQSENRLNLLFSNPVYRQRLSQRALASLQAGRRSHIVLMQAVLEARAGRWKSAIAQYINSVKLCPRRVLPITARFLLQGLKVT